MATREFLAFAAVELSTEEIATELKGQILQSCDIPLTFSSVLFKSVAEADDWHVKVRPVVVGLEVTDG